MLVAAEPLNLGVLLERVDRLSGESARARCRSCGPLRLDTRLKPWHKRDDGSVRRSIEDMQPSCGVSEKSAAIVNWRAAREAQSGMTCTRIPLSASREWALRDGCLRHRTGRFFLVAGVTARSNHPNLDGIVQPMILQPEIGLLGLLLGRSSSGVQVLLQAKTEPGNVRATHLAPTVQATQSNYQKVHGGAPTAYLGYFLDTRGHQVLSDTCESEQGTRFFGKYNRNMTVLASDSPEPVDDRWRWCEMSAFLATLHHDYCVNTDARSALVCSDWQMLSSPVAPFSGECRPCEFQQALRKSWLAGEADAQQSTEDLRSRLSSVRAAIDAAVSRVSLDGLEGWRADDDGIVDVDRRRFSVRYFAVETGDREVAAWDQPLLEGGGTGRSYLLCRRQKGILHFLLVPSVEVGFCQFAQYGPTIQVEPAQWEKGAHAWTDAVLAEGITHARCLQSDEGGRFHYAVVEYRIIEIPEALQLPARLPFVSATLRQLYRLLRRPGTLTNELRTNISLLLRFL